MSQHRVLWASWGCPSGEVMSIDCTPWCDNYEEALVIARQMMRIPPYPPMLIAWMFHSIVDVRGVDFAVRSNLNMLYKKIEDEVQLRSNEESVRNLKRYPEDQAGYVEGKGLFYIYIDSNARGRRNGLSLFLRRG